MKYVILGNGISGICAAETIRQYDPQSSITMIADESVTPYSRPMISMVLSGEAPPEKLPIRSDRFYEDLDITAVLGNRATGIDVNRKQVIVDNNEPHHFDRLLIATGADPRPIDADGTDLKNIFFMRTETHVRRMLEAIPGVKKALVLGGGLVGFKAAYGLIRRGIKVTMLITSGYPLSLQVDETAGNMILGELQDHGLDVRVGISVKAFEGDVAVTGARLSDGSSLRCDIVIVGKGVLPALSFVPRDAIAVDLGIVVNGHMQTSAAGIYAAGDVAESIDIARQIRWVNAIWPEAVTQGHIAGMNMTGRPVAYKGSLSRNVLRILDLDVMTVGLVNPPENSGYEIVSAVNQRRKTYRKLVFRDNILVGALLLNDIEQGGIFLGLIQNEMPLDLNRRSLLDTSFNFKQLLP